MTTEESAARLKEFRKALGFSQSDLAKLAGHHKRTVINFENPKQGRTMSKSFALALHAVTGVGTPWLLGEVGEPESPLDLVGRPFTLEFFHQWETAKGTAKAPLTLAQKDAVCVELIEWVAVFDAAARAGKFQLAREASMQGRKAASELPGVPAKALLREPGMFLDFRPHGVKKVTKEVKERIAGINLLREVASPLMLMEAGLAIDADHADKSVTKLVARLREAADRLEMMPRLHRATVELFTDSFPSPGSDRRRA